MRLVERHIIKDNRFEDVCLKSGLLYNYVLFNVRQGIFSGDYINEYEFSTKLCKENQVDFRNLPSVVSQQVVAQVFSVTKSWMKSKKEYEKNPSKFLSRPKLPKYKRGKKQNMVVFTTSSCRLKCDTNVSLINKINNFSNVREKKFDFVIYPLKLIITVGLDYKTLCDRFENMEPEHEGKWGDEDDMDKEASFVNLVRDRDDDDKFAILWNFSSDDDLIMRNICHESFHIAMSVCQFCDMSLGFKVGEDEHAAYIAGFAGDCVSEFINSKNTD